jgi:hypothetical protein
MVDTAIISSLVNNISVENHTVGIKKDMHLVLRQIREKTITGIDIWQDKEPYIIGFGEKLARYI